MWGLVRLGNLGWLVLFDYKIVEDVEFVGVEGHSGFEDEVVCCAFFVYLKS